MRPSTIGLSLLLLLAGRVTAGEAVTPVKADVVFAFDTTGSMGGEINVLKSSLSTTVIPGVRASVPDVGFGLVDFRDFRYPGDPMNMWVVRLLSRVQTVVTSQGVAQIQNYVNYLYAEGGGDIPEAGWEAMYSIAGGPPITVQGSNPAGTPPEYESDFHIEDLDVPPPEGESYGTLGGVGFRSGALPIIIAITDAEWHDAPGSGGLNPYPESLAGVPSRADAIARLNAIGARVISVVSQPSTGGSGDPRTQGRLLAEATGAVVSPADWGIAGERPVACGGTQCCTGVNGAGEAPSSPDGACPLVFRIAETGAGLGTVIVDAVEILVRAMTPKDTSTVVSSSPNPSVPGQTVTFTATVSVAPPGTGTPTGTVTFFDGTEPLGSSALSSGQAVLEISTLTLGGHAITATYQGDDDFNGSTSAELIQTVQEISPPSAVIATANSASSVSLTWMPSPGATSYEISRSAAGFSFTVVGTVPAPPFTDDSVSPDAAYLYRVRAIDGAGGFSLPSNADLATTVALTDNPLQPEATAIKAVHLTQLRIAVSAVRELAGLPVATFADGLASASPIRTVHVTELRGALDAARDQLMLSPVSYTDATLQVGVTLVKAAHVEDLRSGVK